MAILAFWGGRQAVLERLYPFGYRDEIITYARENGLDPLFIASIIKNESRFNPSAVSKKGAVGLMQVMPETGRWVAEQLGFAGYDPEMLKDPATNIMIGSWYLAELRREFSGKVVLVVAAYNCGRGRVREWAERHGDSLDPPSAVDPALWPPPEVVEDFPLSAIEYQETRNYVRGVLSALECYRDIYQKTLPSDVPSSGT